MVKEDTDDVHMWSQCFICCLCFFLYLKEEGWSSRGKSRIIHRASSIKKKCQSAKRDF